MAGSNIRVFKNSEGNIVVRINGLDISAEAFESTHASEYRITVQEAAAIQDKIDDLIPDND